MHFQSAAPAPPPRSCSVSEATHESQRNLHQSTSAERGWLDRSSDISRALYRQSPVSRHDTKLLSTLWLAIRNAGVHSRPAVGSRFMSSASHYPPSSQHMDISPQELPLESVIKVFATISNPNYLLPWQNKPQKEITGSGFAIHGRRVLTNAHVVADQTYVMVRKHGSPHKYTAKVLAVGHECDIALLTVEDEAFWSEVIPLEFGGIPELQDAVSVIGYPTGGDNISVTGGVVSRVEPQQYAHGASHLLAIQIDAAINPGNSGGPAIDPKEENKVVGIAFQNLVGAENIGFIIPVPIIQHFLEDLERFGEYQGFCSLGIHCQSLDNKHLRKYLKMKKGQTGILINYVQALASTSRQLQKGDVILSFDGHSIANDGTVAFRKRERISFDFLVSMKFAGDTATIRILRDGQELDVQVELQPIHPLVPVHHFDRLPSYMIHAGLVFTALTQPYLHEYGDDWFNTSPRKLCYKAVYGIMDQPNKQVVVLSHILVDEVNMGYQNMTDLMVLAVNGVPVLNLAHMHELIASNKEPFLRFDMEDDRVIVLETDEAKAATQAILKRHRIQKEISADLSLLPKQVSSPHQDITA